MGDLLRKARADQEPTARRLIPSVLRPGAHGKRKGLMPLPGEREDRAVSARGAGPLLKA
jgi:hypothetical protein